MPKLKTHDSGHDETIAGVQLYNFDWRSITKDYDNDS